MSVARPLAPAASVMNHARTVSLLTGAKSTPSPTPFRDDEGLIRRGLLERKAHEDVVVVVIPKPAESVLAVRAMWCGRLEITSWAGVELQPLSH